jgi:hypothetical protein
MFNLIEFKQHCKINSLKKKCPNVVNNLENHENVGELIPKINTQVKLHENSNEKNKIRTCGHIQKEGKCFNLGSKRIKL